jgi:2-polyprenylphenol 6-hydroxylase
MMNEETDVLIVGAGLVGLSLAAALSTSELQVRVIDAGAAPDSADVEIKSLSDYSLNSGVSPRVSAVTPGSRKFLTRTGAWDRIAPDRISAFRQMHVWDGRGTAHIEFGDSEPGSSPPGDIVENKRIETALVETLETADKVEIEWQAKLSEVLRQEAGYGVKLDDGRRFDCSLLVGADGGNSRVRELCGIRTLGWSYDQVALVTTVETEQGHDFIARQCFTGDGPVAFLPLPDEHLCSIVWSVGNATDLLAMSDKDFCETLSIAFESRLGDVRGTDRRYAFPLKHQHALQYVGRHLALIGDAAHAIHPLAGQGANLGFADARTLAQMLRGARLEGRSPGDLAVLEQYQRQRRAENLAMGAAMEAFNQLYGTDNPGISWLRNAGMRFVNDSGLLKSLITRLGSE